MKVFKGITDNWGISIQYHHWDRSITLQFLNMYVIFVAHKWWRH